MLGSVESVEWDPGKGPMPSVWHHRAQNVEFRNWNLTMVLILANSKAWGKALILTDPQPPLL